jgi:hypothetical protein
MTHNGIRAGRTGAGLAAAAIISALMMLAVAGCSSYSPPAEQTEEEKSIALNFDLSKCQQMQQGLYKCPAMDKPICDAGFANPTITCLRIGHKGSVFVQSGVTTP